MYHANFIRTLIFTFMVSFISIPTFAQSGKLARSGTKINPFEQKTQSLDKNGFDFQKTIQPQSQPLFGEQLTPAQEKFRKAELGLLPLRAPKSEGYALSRAVPANDDCHNAIEIRCGDNVTGSTTNANNDPNVTDYVFGDAPGVWYKIYGTGESVTISLCNDQTNYDTRLTVFEGNCDRLDFLGTNDDGCEVGGKSLATFNTEIGKTYYVFVSGYYNAIDTGDFRLSVSCGNTCDISDLFVDFVTCNDDGTYVLWLKARAQYLPLNGDIKVVVGGKVIEIERTNITVDGPDQELFSYLFDLERFRSGGYLTIRLPYVDVYEGNGEIYVQADRGCGYTLRDFEAPFCEGASSCDISELIDVEINCLDEENYVVCATFLGRVPQSQENLVLFVNSQEVNIEFVYRGADRFRVCFIQPANGRTGNDLFVKWEEGCTYTARDAWDDPDCRDEGDDDDDDDDDDDGPNCSITSVEAFNVSCDEPHLGDDEYFVHLRFYGENLDEGGTIPDNFFFTVNGRSIEVPDAFLDDTNPTNFAVAFDMPVEESGDHIYIEWLDCTFEATDVWDNPCGYECDLDGINLIDFACNEDTYDALFMLNGTIGENVVPDNFAVFFDGVDVTDHVDDVLPGEEGEGLYIILEGLPANEARGIDIHIRLNDNCEISVENVFDAPNRGCDTDGEECDIRSIFPYANECNLGYQDVGFAVVGSGLDIGDLSDAKLVVAHQPRPINGYYYSTDAGAWIVSTRIYGEFDGQVEAFLQLENGCSKTFYYDPTHCFLPRMSREIVTGLQLYPNPSTGQIKIVAGNIENAQIAIYNAVGQRIISKNVDMNVETEVNLSGYDNGIYIIQLIGDNHREVKKVILSR